MKTLKDKIAAGATVIDVRTAEEYDEVRYPGAINIPVDSLARKLGSVGPKDKPVIVYCESGGRSSVAAAILKANGFTDVTNAGGIRSMPL